MRKRKQLFKNCDLKCNNIKNAIKSKKKLKKKICENLITDKNIPKIFDYCLFPKEKIKLERCNFDRKININNYNYVLFLFINIPYVVYLIPKMENYPIAKFTFDMDGEYGDLMKRINGYANSLINFRKKFRPDIKFVKEVIDSFIENYDINMINESAFCIFHPKIVRSIRDLCTHNCDLVIFDFDSQKIDGHCLIIFHFPNDIIKIIKI
jgi:hypothetical protein